MWFTSIRVHRFISVFVVGARIRNFFVRTDAFAFKAGDYFYGLFYPFLYHDQDIFLLWRLGVLRRPFMDSGVVEEDASRQTLSFCAVVKAVRRFFGYVVQRFLC